MKVSPLRESFSQLLGASQRPTLRKVGYLVLPWICFLAVLVPSWRIRDLSGGCALHRILWEADLLLLPSLWYESYSIVVDEAFSVGLPVMVSSHGAPAERVIPGINGLAAPPGDVAAWPQHIQRL